MSRKKIIYPNNAPAALSIFDDADEGDEARLEPVYAALHKLDLRVTRSTWVFPSRRGERGASLSDEGYCKWLKKIKSQNFEIALHNIGNGAFTREEIKEGLKKFREILGEYPKIHTNHHSNPDNVYWNAGERFVWPANWLYRLFGRDMRKTYLGSNPDAPCFWADLLYQNVKYVRGLVFNDINTLKMDPYMPYWDPRRPLVPYWFSSTDMRDISYFTRVLTARNLDRLCGEGGMCIGYTHFGTKGFLDERGSPSKEFLNALRLIKERNIWVAPVSELLDHLLQNYRYYDSELTRLKSFELSVRWMIKRLGRERESGE